MGVIIPVSCVAYLLSLEEGESFDIPNNNIDISDDKDINLDINTPDTSTDKSSDQALGIKAEVESNGMHRKELEVESESESEVVTSNDGIYPYDIDPSLLPEKTLYEGFNEKISEIQQQIANEKTLYEGFNEKISGIRQQIAKENQLPSPNTNESSLFSPSASGGESSLDQNTNTTSPTTDDSESQRNLNSNLTSPDYSKDKFSPNTLGSLDEEITRNKGTLDNLKDICKDPDTKDSIYEHLLEERKYLLDQKAKHYNSVLQEAKNNSIQDTDMDKLCNEVSELKTSVDDLVIKSENLKHRKLEDNENEKEK